MAFVKINPAGSVPEPEYRWNLCMFCQTDTGQALSSPHLNHREPDVKKGYRTLTERIMKFYVLKRLPFSLPKFLLDLFKPSENDEKQVVDFVNMLHQNSAVYHIKCYKDVSDSKLERIKKKMKEDEAKAKKRSPVKTRRLCPEGHKQSCIFHNIFCGNKGSFSSDIQLGELYQVRTYQCDANMKQYAAFLNDNAIKSRLADAIDLVAQDALYHNVCYLELKTLCRNKEALNAREELEGTLEKKTMAISKIISDLCQAKMTSETPPVFHMSDIKTLYKKYSGDVRDCHSTRLRNSLLAACPLLEEFVQPGRKGAVITFKEDACTAIQSLSGHGDINKSHLEKAAKVLRDTLFSEEKNEILENFLELVLKGPHSERLNRSEESCAGAVSTIAQLLKFHAVKRLRPRLAERTLRKRNRGINPDPDGPAIKRRRRHDRERETDAPLYLGLKMYAATRKKGLLQKASNLGVSIGYKRARSYVEDAAATVAATYQREGVVFPPTFRGGKFITGAADNFDHDTASNTAKSSFHGTAISMVEHSSRNNAGPLDADLQQSVPEITYVHQSGDCTLPIKYSNVEPCYLDKKKAINPKGIVDRLLEPTRPPMEGEETWLEKIRANNFIRWATHHAQHDRGHKKPDSIEILPLFRESANTFAMMVHSMETIKAATEHLNPGQVPVITVDQPLYAICKTIQYLNPAMYGNSKYFVMFGGLHVEMNVLKLIGEWVEGSGWVEALVQAGVTTLGRGNAMISASHVKRSRYGHEVSVAALSVLQRRGYEEYVNSTPETELMSFEEWRCARRESDPQYRYWDITIQLELAVLRLVYSIRTGSFYDYKTSLRRLAPWFFGMDHQNYARWIPVHLQDLENLTPDLENEFKAGKFVVQKTNRAFSKMARDQAHEQLNAHLKGDGGIIGLTENDDAHRKWLLAAPLISKKLQDLEKKLFPEELGDTLEHCSENNASQTAFKVDVENLLSILDELCANPFEDRNDMEDEVKERELYNIYTKEVASDSVVRTTMNIEEKNLKQYRDFVETRLKPGSESNVFAPLTKNNYTLFSTKAAKKSKPVEKLRKAKAESDVLSRFNFASQVRETSLEELYCYEFHDWPQSLASENGEMRKGTKSQLIGCLLKFLTDDTPEPIPAVDAKVLDGAAIVHVVKPGLDSLKFDDYIKLNFIPFIKKQCQTIVRLDIVFDRYFPQSLKSATRGQRGEGVRVQVRPETRIPGGGWPLFLKNSSNKDELFCLLASAVAEADLGGTKVYATRHATVLTNGDRADLAGLAPCNHEEADGRLLLHVAHAAASGCSRVMVRTVDTDVLVLAVACFNNIDGLEELWVSMGTDKSHSYIAVHEIARNLGPMATVALPAFHAFTGCDTTSSFFNRGKVSAMTTWNSHPELTDAFIALGEGRLDTPTLKSLEKFVCLWYDMNTSTFTVNQTRMRLAGEKNRGTDTIPPTSDALLQHSRRASLQARMWNECLQPLQQEHDPSDWGWSPSSSGYKPLWTAKPSAVTGCSFLVACNCKKCTASCLCKTKGFTCVQYLCKCKCK